jgi:hypothetical protein
VFSGYPKFTTNKSLDNFRYFSQIDEDLLKEILEIYQLDFDLFGYNSTEYINYVKPTKKKKKSKNG